MAGKARPLAERFWPKVDVRGADECWPWLAGLASGYGQIASGGAGGRKLMAHRVAYEFLVGPIPAGLVLDHLCRVPSCVNPAHLEPVTQRVNLLRDATGPGLNTRKEQCPRGHAYDAANTYLYRGKRDCRVCRSRRARESEERARHGV